jgi:ATP-dependent DNA ligase
VFREPKPSSPLHFFIFDLLILRGRDVMAEPLVKRRALIEKARPADARGPDSLFADP